MLYRGNTYYSSSLQMIIKKAVYLQSCTESSKCPEGIYPEYAFIGRSNVGKSSLINMLTGISGLAHTSAKPGKTQVINHFLINENWYLVDLPGYGFAKVSKDKREKWDQMIQNYLNERENLQCVFVLIDSRLDPQKSDFQFMEWLAISGIPFAMVFTKADKLSKSQTMASINKYKKEMEKFWEELPVSFVTSSETTAGKKEILEFISDLNSNFSSLK